MNIRLLALALVLLLPVVQGHAQMLICKSHATDFHDRQRLRAAMQQVLPADVAADGIADVCRNPGYAYGFLSTPSRLRTDGAMEHWELVCHRNLRRWTCKPPEHHQVISVDAEIKGVQRQLKVWFDDATGLVRARSLALRAEQLIQAPEAAPLPACRSGNFGGQDPSAWLDYRRSRSVTAEDTEIELSVEISLPGIYAVTTGDASFEMRFSEASDVAPGDQVCWAYVIYLT